MPRKKTANSRIAKCVIVNRDNHVLLLTIGDHTKYPYMSYMPDLPGGIVEEHETSTEGMVREIAEETGIVIEPDELVCVDRKVVSIPWVTRRIEKVLYTTRVDLPEIVLSHEHESYRWVTVDELQRIHFNSLYFDDFIVPAIAQFVRLTE